MTIVCCAGLLIREGHILLGKRSSNRISFPNVWDLPGGRQEQGESLNQTLHRELQEELGIVPTVTRYLDKLDILSQPDHLECHIFLVAEWEGIPSNLARNEHDFTQWFSVEEACSLKLACSEYPDIFRNAVELTNRESSTILKI
jgi:8-oxo-dGTP diphosphatase